MDVIYNFEPLYWMFFALILIGFGYFGLLCIGSFFSLWHTFTSVALDCLWIVYFIGTYIHTYIRTSLEHLSNTWETFLLYRTSFGLYGSLVEQVGHLLSLVPNDCKLALCKVGLNNVTSEMISNLLSGIELHPSHPSTTFFNTHFLKGEA